MNYDPEDPPNPPKRPSEARDEDESIVCKKPGICAEGIVAWLLFGDGAMCLGCRRNLREKRA